MTRTSLTAVIAALLLSGCSNYVGQVDAVQVKAENPPPLKSFDDGERYVRALRTQFQRRIELLEAQDNVLQGGIIGGGIMALVGIVNKAPRTALNGAAIGGGTYAYGQTLNPDALRKIYLIGDQSLVCVLNIGRRANEPATLIERYTLNARTKATDLATAIAYFEAHQVDASAVYKNQIAEMKATVLNVRVNSDSWLQNGAIVAQRMATAAEAVVSDINLAIKNAEPTLSSLRNASSAALSALPTPIPLKETDNVGKIENLSAITGKSANPADKPVEAIMRGIAATHSELLAINATINTFQDQIPLPNQTSFEACQPQIDGEQPMLTFKMEPQQIDTGDGNIAILTITGGRAPYTWVADQNATTAFVITPIGSGSSSGIYQIKRNNGTSSQTGTIVFSNVHPRASPQSYTIPAK